MPAFLVPVDPGQCLIPLEKAVVLIGRQADCDVSLTHSRKISRKHCCIAQVNNRFVVRDLGSTNGVFLNGSRIKKEAELAVGDQLTIGDVRFQVQSEAPVNEKKKPSVRPDAAVTAEATVSRARAPVKRRQMIAPPNAPVAIEDGDGDFAVESTNQHPALSPRKAAAADDSAASDSDDDEDRPFKLAADK